MKASISLTTVLVIGSMLLLSSIVLIVSSLDLLESTTAYSNFKIARINSNTCLEEALFKIKANHTYTGSNQISVNNGLCNYTVTNQNGDTTKKIISISGSLNKTNYTSTKFADTTQLPISLITLD